MRCKKCLWRTAWIKGIVAKLFSGCCYKEWDAFLLKFLCICWYILGTFLSMSKPLFKLVLKGRIWFLSVGWLSFTSMGGGFSLPWSEPSLITSLILIFCSTSLVTLSSSRKKAKMNVFFSSSFDDSSLLHLTVHS